MCGKYFDGGEKVILRGNFSKEITAMYSVFIVPIGEENELKSMSASKDIFFSQIDYDRTYDRAYASQVGQVKSRI